MTSDEIIGFKKSSKINGLKLDETCRTPNSYFKCRVLITNYFFMLRLLSVDNESPHEEQWIK
ncbi:MAG: hypothetical protein KHZ57_32025, partial [Hungatella hathewayi]|nr:hypothetical protein [Hungatella hathewayi]